MQKNMKNWQSISIIVAALLLLHYLTIHQQSYFVDEVDEIGFSRGPIWDAIWMPDSMPPLFNLMLRGWLSIFHSDASGRWLSAVIGIVTVVVSYAFINALSDSKTAMITASLFAFCPLQLYFAQLIRGYSLMTFWAVVCVGCFLISNSAHRWRKGFWVGYTLASVSGMYTHYYFPMIPISLGVAWLWSYCRNGQNTVSWKVFLFGYFAMFLLTLPVLAFLKIDFPFQHNQRTPRPLSFGALGYTYFSYYSGYALGPSQLQIRTMPVSTVLRNAFPWLLLSAIISAPLLYRGAFQLIKIRLFAPVFCLTTVPLLLIGIVGATTGITYNVRFVSWLAFPISVWMGIACRGLWDESNRIRLVGFVAIAACFGLFALANYQRTNDARYQIEDTRAVVKYLRGDQMRDRPIFVVSDYMVRPLSYYGQELRFLELPEIGNQGKEIISKNDLTTAIQSMESAATDEFWLVYSRSFHGDPSGLLLQHLEKRGVKKQRTFAGVELYLGNRASLLKD